MSAASPSGFHELFAPYQPVRELGSRPIPLYVVRQAGPGGQRKLFVAERFAGCARPSDDKGATFVAEARRISTLASPNVARVRELVVRGDDLVVVWDFIAGDKIVETWLSGGMPLEVALRLILDVLAGVGAIHGLRDAKQQPMHLAHGEVSTATIVLGLDGVARVLHAIARRLPDGQAEEASFGYLAPEVHVRGAYDARADVFGVGVLLWEALAGKRLFSTGDGTSAAPDLDANRIIARVRGGIAPPPVPDKAPWARALCAVAAKALAASPDDRWPTAAAMAGEIRKVAGLRLAPAAAAMAFAKMATAERVEARRARLESSVAMLPPDASPAGRSSTFRPRPGGAGDVQSALAAAPSKPADVPVGPAAPSSKPEEASHVGLEAEIELVPESLPSPAQSPPPLPARALQPSPPAPYFAASIDVPISIAPPPADPHEVSPTSVEPTSSLGRDERASRRRMLVVLGGVGALGMMVFALAGWRVAHRQANTWPSSRTVADVVPVVISQPTFPSAPAAREGGVATGPAPTSALAPVVAIQATVATAAVVVAPSQYPRTPRFDQAARDVANPPPIAARSAPSPKPSPASLPIPRPAAPAAPRPHSAANSKFDPNSL